MLTNPPTRNEKQNSPPAARTAKPAFLKKIGRTALALSFLSLGLGDWGCQINPTYRVGRGVGPGQGAETRDIDGKLLSRIEVYEIQNSLARVLFVRYEGGQPRHLTCQYVRDGDSVMGFSVHVSQKDGVWVESTYKPMTELRPRERMLMKNRLGEDFTMHLHAIVKGAAIVQFTDESSPLHGLQPRAVTLEVKNGDVIGGYRYEIVNDSILRVTSPNWDLF